MPTPIPLLSRARRIAPKVVLFFWALALLSVGSLLLARHVVPLPIPQKDDRALSLAVAKSRSPAELGRPLALHILLATCPCSQRILTHLLKRGRHPAIAERVVLVFDTPEIPQEFLPHHKALLETGFLVEPLSEDALSRTYPVAATPLLVLASADGVLRYVGGYTRRKQSPLIEDGALLQMAFFTTGSLGPDPNEPPLPVFGCPASARLRATFDPLGLSNWRNP